jgi:amidophosphoribosyltransferase
LGVNIATSDELIASAKTTEEVRRAIGADSLKYLSIGALLKTPVSCRCDFCTGCLSGEYPIFKCKNAI